MQSLNMNTGLICPFNFYIEITLVPTTGDTYLDFLCKLGTILLHKEKLCRL